MNRKWIIGIVITVIIAGAVVGFGQNQAIAVETVEIKEAVFTDSFREDGIVFAKEERPIFTQTGGIVETVHVENGDEVLVGDIILALETKQLELRKKSIQGQLLSTEGQLAAESEKVKSPDLAAQKNVVNLAKSDMEQGKLDFERAGALYEAGAISLSAYETAENAYKGATEKYNMEASRLSGLIAQNTVGEGTAIIYDGQIMQLQAELAIIEDQIEKSIIRAEVNGTVSALNVKAGEAVFQMTEIANIINGHELKIESLVLTEDALGLEVGQSVQIVRSRKGLEEEIAGRIMKIDPVASETVSALGLKERRVLVTIDPDPFSGYEAEMDFIPGSDVDVVFVAYQSDNAIIIPKSAVFPTETGDAVWMVKNGEIILKQIETGYEATRYMEVVNGLNAGDHVLKNYDTEGASEGVKAKSSNL